MTHRLTLIGAGGVGKAHAIAALNLGWEIGLVVDTDPNVLIDYKKDTLVNVWGSFRESASYPNSKRPIVADNINQVNIWWETLNEQDVVIIATPNETHNSLVRQIHSLVGSNVKILVEKPYQSDLVAPNVFVSSEWLYHDLIGIKAPIEDLGFCHNNYDPNIHTDLVSDLGFHLLSILYNSIGDSLLGSLNYVELAGTKPPIDLYRSVRLIIVDTDRQTKDIIGVKLAYNPVQQGIKSFLGLPSSHPSEIKICYTNGIIALDWQENLFELQLVRLVMDEHKITSFLATKFDKILRMFSNENC